MPADRDGRVGEGNQQVSVADIAVVRGVAGVVPGAGELDVAGECVADGGGPELGQGGQGGVPADAVPAPGLGLVPAEHVFSRFERFLSRPLLIPVKKKSSLAFRVHPGRY